MSSFSPASILNGVLETLRRIAHSPETVETGPPPVAEGHVRVRALALLVDGERCGQIVRAGEIYDFAEAAAKDFIRRNLAERIA